MHYILLTSYQKDYQVSVFFPDVSNQPELAVESLESVSLSETEGRFCRLDI